MPNLERIKVYKANKRKLEEVSRITGMKYTKTFGVFSESIPVILNSEVVKKPRSKERKLRITFLQEFRLP